MNPAAEERARVSEKLRAFRELWDPNCSQALFDALLADYVAEGRDMYERDISGRTILMYCRTPAKARAVLAISAAGINLRDKRDFTALMLAGVSAELVDILVDANADMTATWHGMDILSMVDYNAPDVIRALIRRGADPCALTSNGNSHIHMQCGIGSSGNVAALLEHEGVRAQLNVGGARTPHTPARPEPVKARHSPLVAAIDRGSFDIVCLLLSHGADPCLQYQDDQGESTGHTSLYYARYANREYTMDMKNIMWALLDASNDHDPAYVAAVADMPDTLPAVAQVMREYLRRSMKCARRR